MPAVVAGSVLQGMLKKLMGGLGLKAAAGGAGKKHHTQLDVQSASEFSGNSPESMHTLQSGSVRDRCVHADGRLAPCSVHR